MDQQMKNMINGILERVKNRSTNCLKNADVPDVSKGSDVCPVCKGSEWILTEKDGIETAVPCKCRERAIMLRRLRCVQGAGQQEESVGCLPDHKSVPRGF